MMSPTKFNYLHKVLQKNHEQVDMYGGVMETSPQKTKWMKKLNIMSPGKLEAPPSSPTNLSKLENTYYHELQCDFTSRSNKLSQTTKHSCSVHKVNDSLGVIDLETVINDFEQNYFSPTKNQSPVRTNKFVKKMVAIFEKKTANPSKNLKKSTENLERRKSSPDVFHEEINDYFMPVDNTYVIQRQTKSLTSSLADCTKLPNISECHETWDKEISYESMESESTDDSLGNFPPPRSDESLKRERAPKIIGAFLKKPIQIDDTTIDWLPTPTTKLPRKKSFTKFFTLLRGKKVIDNSNKLSTIKMKWNKKPKESHDSGYDEKSISPTSSLKSTSSFRNTLLNENNIPHVSHERVTNVSTFHTFDPPSPDTDTVDEIFSDNHNINDHKKIIFEDIPRSEVRLSLGPFFPVQPKLFVKLVNRKNTIKEDTEEIHYGNISRSNMSIYENYSSSQLPSPKYPLIFNNNEEYDNSITPFDNDEFNQVELRKKTAATTTAATAAAWTFPSSSSIYDVPKYCSISEPSLFTEEHSKCYSYNNIFMDDVPRIDLPPRPKSSFFEDAQSLKRRTACATPIHSESRTGFYASPTANSAKFATIKPRTSALIRNREFLSMERFKALHTLTVPTNYNCHDNDVTTEF